MKDNGNDNERLPLIHKNDDDNPNNNDPTTTSPSSLLLPYGSTNATIGHTTDIASSIATTPAISSSHFEPPSSSTKATTSITTHNPSTQPPPQSSSATTSDYLQTYTAGEDPNRLAAMAKELGLERRRATRPPLRSVNYETKAKHFFRTTFGRIVFEEQEAETKHDFWETLAGVAGNVLEWYDFAVFGYFGDIIGLVFFPPSSSSDDDETTSTSNNASTTAAFLVFGGAFLMRPVGGLLLGYLGDVYGRRRALYVSIFLMAFPTFFMGCLPSYEKAGIISPILLVVIRALQGMSVGGQLMSSLVFTLENVPRESWGLYGSFVWATGNFGVLLGGLVGYAIRGNMTEDELVRYGWRIPFLSGVIVSFAGFYLRSAEEEEDGNSNGDGDRGGNVNVKGVESTEATDKEDKQSTTNPFATMLQPGNIRPLMAASMVPMIWSAGFYLSFVWMAIYMSTLTTTPVPHAFAINSATLFIGVCLLFPIAGWLSDKFGRRCIMSIGGTSLALLGPTLLRYIGNGNHPAMAFLAQLVLGVCLSFWGSPMGAWLTESFSPEARLTSVSLGYNMAHAIVGGSTPALATYLVDRVGTEAPGW
eukprot:CAMPEP_0183737108 /NCGR_PEP_ID=MMETSP0737-20130205/51056_1 /TAXON_ID=385413 /ORGANISM="Thalassiosira miniscula, Strain CCMP1093" /LENGTH=589 /DNA_ID=CAMNT_0025971305 /DNA_START=17 /DNA_END=1783 /DNA_ORIENTATION=-